MWECCGTRRKAREKVHEKEVCTEGFHDLLAISSFPCVVVLALHQYRKAGAATNIGVQLLGKDGELVVEQSKTEPGAEDEARLKLS